MFYFKVGDFGGVVALLILVFKRVRRLFTSDWLALSTGLSARDPRWPKGLLVLVVSSFSCLSAKVAGEKFSNNGR